MVRILEDEEAEDIFGFGLRRLLTLDVDGKEVFVYTGGWLLKKELNKLADWGCTVFDVEGIKVIELPKGYGVCLPDKVLWITENITRNDVKKIALFFKERWMRRRRIKRYGYCQICGKFTDHILLHHISYKGNITIDVCASCHAKIHKGKNPYYRRFLPMDGFMYDPESWKKKPLPRILRG
jgi:hypothetical protein